MSCGSVTTASERQTQQTNVVFFQTEVLCRVADDEVCVSGGEPGAGGGGRDVGGGGDVLGRGDERGVGGVVGGRV